LNNYYDTEKVYKDKISSGFEGWHKNYLPSTLYNALQLLGEERTAISSFLELGCGCGESSIELSLLGFNGFGVDISETAIKTAKNNLKRVDPSYSDQLEFYAYDIIKDDLSKLGIGFDLIYMDSVLHFFGKSEDRVALYNNIKRVLSSDGSLFISCLLVDDTIKDDKRVVKDPYGNYVAKNYVRIFFDFEALKIELSDHGFSIKSYQIVEQLIDGDMMRFVNLILNRNRKEVN
jgi:SAM-dependent methyltransferase